MTVCSQRLSFPNVILALMLPQLMTAAGNEYSGVFDIDSGAAIFEAATNVPGVEVKGKSTALSGHVTITRDERGFTLAGIDVVVPVKSLATGMNVRDEHMRKYIFTAGDSQLPDVRFLGETVACPAALTSQEVTCRVSGTLSIRGTARPFTVNLHVRSQSGSSAALHGSGDAAVKLSDYGISAPSQFGVTANDEVKLHLDLSARQRPVSSSAARSAR
jgi:polyisoprenoid-binding protein YceI